MNLCCNMICSHVFMRYLYSKRHVLHRDLSAGNVLYVVDSASRPLLTPPPTSVPAQETAANGCHSALTSISLGIGMYPDAEIVQLPTKVRKVNVNGGVPVGLNVFDVSLAKMLDVVITIRKHHYSLLTSTLQSTWNLTWIAIKPEEP